MLTQDQIKAKYTYEPKTGALISKATNRSITAKQRDGYLYVRIHGDGYLAHRVIWMYMEGYWPEHDIDHINGNRADNTWENLRHVTKSCNRKNAIKPPSNNASGFIGVSWYKTANKWLVNISIRGKHTHVGLYRTLKEAAEARIRAEKAQSDYDCNQVSYNEQKYQKLWPTEAVCSKLN